MRTRYGGSVYGVTAYCLYKDTGTRAHVCAGVHIAGSNLATHDTDFQIHFQMDTPASRHPHHVDRISVSPAVAPRTGIHVPRVLGQMLSKKLWYDFLQKVSTQRR